MISCYCGSTLRDGEEFGGGRGQRATDGTDLFRGQTDAKTTAPARDAGKGERQVRFKLRHPIRAIREPFGTAGLVVACVALIAALGGSAIAANGALTGKQKNEVKAIAKKFAGKRGAAGAAGAPGANGAPGARGAQGAQGAQGIQGGQGIQGVQGNPWTAGGTLPPGETLTGVWTTQLVMGPNSEYLEFSFPIPLAEGSTYNVYYIDNQGGGSPVGQESCEGDAGEPIADPGTLCIYESVNSVNWSNVGVVWQDEAGAVANATTESGVPVDQPSFGSGTWAVTAPTPAP